jgi:hypothetical protein
MKNRSRPNNIYFGTTYPLRARTSALR